MKKCYIYTRVSTATQVEGYSLDAQRSELYRYAGANELDVVGEYCDAGISGGSIDGRADFQRMMDDVESEKDTVSYVLVFKLSRFGRNAADVLKSVQRLQDYDVNLISINDGIDSSSSSGKLMLSIMSAVAEMEKENISAQFLAGRMQKIRNGGWYGGPIPYGYSCGDGNLIVNEEEAKIVRGIFDRYTSESASLVSVVTWLIGLGIKTHSGKPFTWGTVAGIIDNPIYCGDICLYKRSNKDKNSKQREIQHVKGTHEAIISRDLYEKAQRKREERKIENPNPTGGDRISILSGLLKCPVCGAGLVNEKSVDISPITGEKLGFSYGYKCPNRRKLNGRTCDFKKRLRQSLLDDAVEEYINRVSSLPSFTKHMEEQLLNGDELEKIETEIRELQSEYSKAESEKDRLNRSIDELDVFSSTYAKEYDELSARVEKLYDRMDEVDEKLEAAGKRRAPLYDSQLTLEKIKSHLEEFPDIYSKMSRNEKRTMMRFLIDRIDVFPERRDDGKIIKSITFKFPVYKHDKHGNPVRKLDQTVGFKMRCDNIGRTAAESKATYRQIREFIQDKYNVRVTNLYIAQIKRKYGIIERKNYNLRKSEDSQKAPTCPKDKEEYITEALRHFKMIGNEVVDK